MDAYNTSTAALISQLVFWKDTLDTSQLTRKGGIWLFLWVHSLDYVSHFQFANHAACVI